MIESRDFFFFFANFKTERMVRGRMLVFVLEDGECCVCCVLWALVRGVTVNEEEVGSGVGGVRSKRASFGCFTRDVVMSIAPLCGRSCNTSVVRGKRALHLPHAAALSLHPMLFASFPHFPLHRTAHRVLFPRVTSFFLLSLLLSLVAVIGRILHCVHSPHPHTFSRVLSSHFLLVLFAFFFLSRFAAGEVCWLLLCC